MLVSFAAPEDYARYVVSKTMRRKPRPWLWAGSYSYFAWILVRGFQRLRLTHLS